MDENKDKQETTDETEAKPFTDEQLEALGKMIQEMMKAETESESENESENEQEKPDESGELLQVADQIAKQIIEAMPKAPIQAKPKNVAPPSPDTIQKEADGLRAEYRKAMGYKTKD